MRLHREQDYEDSYHRCDECPGGDSCGLCFNEVNPNHWAMKPEQRKESANELDED